MARRRRIVRRRRRGLGSPPEVHDFKASIQAKGAVKHAENATEEAEKGYCTGALRDLLNAQELTASAHAHSHTNAPVADVQSARVALITAKGVFRNHCLVADKALSGLKRRRARRRR